MQPGIHICYKLFKTDMVKVQKIAQNEKQILHVSHAISQERHSI